MSTKYQSPVGNAGYPFLDDNGDPLASGTINTYVTGTTTNKATYKDNAGVASHTNPIVLGADGRVPGDALWLDSDQDYTFLLKNSAGTTIWSIDNVKGIIPPSSLSEWVTGPTPTYVTATTFTVSGDYTSTLHVGRRLQLTDSSTLYASITATSYAAGTGLTTITVLVDGGTSLTANLAACAYGLIANTNSSLRSPARWSASRTTAQSIAHDTAVKVQLNNSVLGVGGTLDVATNYRFTIGAPGDYLIMAYVEITADGGDTGQSVLASIYVNNVSQAQAGNNITPNAGSGDTYMSAHVSCILLNLSVGDYVELFVVQANNSAAARNVTQARISGMLIDSAST